MIKLLFKIFLSFLLIQTTLLSRDIDINSIIKKADSSEKKLFVFLHKTDCGYCDSMIEFTLENDVVKEFINKNFIFVHINIYEKDEIKYKDFIGSGREFAKLMGYNFYPTSLFYDKKGDMIYAVPGYQDEIVFYTILNYIDTKSYIKKELQEFENEFEFNEEL